MAKKINKSLFLAALSAAWILGFSFYFGVLPLLLPALGVALGAGVLIIGGFYGYKAFQKFLNNHKAFFSTRGRSKNLSKLKPDPNYVYTPKPEPQAEIGQYKPTSTANLHKTQLNPDLLKLIAQHLTPREIALLKQADKSLNQDLSFKDNLKDYLKDLGTPEQSFEEKLALFKTACIEIKDTYPQALIDACGIHTLAALPVLDLNKAVKNKSLLNHDYIDYLKPKHLKGYKAMRGYDKLGRPFISVCISTPEGPYVQTAFQRYSDTLMWQAGGQPRDVGDFGILTNARDASESKLFNCLAELLHNTHPTDSLTDQKRQTDQALPRPSSPNTP